MRWEIVIVGAIALCLGSAAAAPEATQPAALPKPKVDHTALEKLGWKLSCQAYTFRALSLFETIDLLHDLGIPYIELYPGQKLSKETPAVKADHHLAPEHLEALIRKLKDAKVTPVNYGVVGVGNDEKSAREVFEFARKLGLETIVTEPDEAMADTLSKLADEYKINVAIHNHPKPSHYWTPDTVLKVVGGKSKRFGACADTGHWYRCGLAPVECLKKLEGRIISLHFKDLSEAKRDVPWGTGVCDAEAMLAEIRRQGLRPVFSIEYESTSGMELVNNVAKCCEFLSTVATEYARE